MVPGAAKADIWRLAVVWRYGGVYVDSDVVALRPFREVGGLQGSESGCICIPNMHSASEGSGKRAKNAPFSGFGM